MKDGIVDQRKRRILSVDGGGILGTFPAAFLAGIESQLDRPIGEYFDLITGTSTGGIIALGLGMGLRAADILDLYERRGPEIFGQHQTPLQNLLNNKLRAIRWLYQRKYSSDSLRAILIELFGEKRLGEAKHRLVIPAWNPIAQSVYIYKTPHHPRFKTDYKSLVVDAALATSAAPTYFQQHITQESVGLIDGGIWANNPIAVGVTEAVGVLNWPGDQISVLSLGCLDEVYTLPKAAGIGSLGTKLVSLFMSGQSHGAMGIAKLLTGHEHEREAIFRVNQAVPSGIYSMDGVSAIKDLKGLGFSHARERFPSLEKVFFTELAESFEPLYTLPEN
ncbi:MULTISPECIES: CBASS cGAMP-activated phospholipase [Cyanophyceae]|uniref:CBASS cGAMP-activated phospholipase n=1 Tax=Cyanophyceae TaxID=3028117 RepID=UPI00168345BA|nr:MULTISPECIES: CBASS cGAMP-activated phospholipase [Cyanophyceae]MBD1919440.1 patatin-like phospholipase family protein [Phormidium sp. FACHB-77]MBD2054292.1 patatin-like phospholipase family protein [Leptolyngbya sp. FACHB-60]